MLPLVAGIFSAALVFVPLVVKPQLGYFFSLAFILLGYAFYLPFVHLKLKLPCMRAFEGAKRVKEGFGLEIMDGIDYEKNNEE